MISNNDKDVQLGRQALNEDKAIGLVCTYFKSLRGRYSPRDCEQGLFRFFVVQYDWNEDYIKKHLNRLLEHFNNEVRIDSISPSHDEDGFTRLFIKFDRKFDRSFEECETIYDKSREATY